MNFSQDEKARSKRTEENYGLFRGEFDRVLTIFDDVEERKHSIHVWQNIAGAITRIFSDLMFLKRPLIQAVAEKPQFAEAVTDFVRRNKLPTMLHESAHTQSYNGWCAFELLLRDGLAYVEELNPATVFPSYSYMSGKLEPSKVRIAWDIEIGKNTFYRFVKTHTPGFIDYELWALNEQGGERVRKVEVGLIGIDVEREETGLGFIPVYFVDNHKTGRDLRGLSDYDDLRNLLKELARIMSQLATQLKKHANARMAVPPGVLDENGRVIAQNLEMIQVDNDENGGLQIPQYIVNNNPLVDKAFEEANMLIEAVCRVSECASVLLDYNVSGGVEKVGALRLRMLRTLAKVQRKLRAYELILPEMIADALNWEGGKGAGILPDDIELKFYTGLPEDMVEKATIEQIRYSAGLQTTSDAIKNMDGLEGPQLEQKVKELEQREEKALARFAGSAPSFHPPA